MTPDWTSKCGTASLYLGDCLDVLPALADGSVDAVVTDPPYSSGGFQEAGKSSGSIGTRSNDTIKMDNLSTRGYQRLMRNTLRFCRDADEIMVFTDWRMWVYTSDALEDAGLRVRNMLVWDKMSMGMGMPWRNQHELIAYAKRIPAKILEGNRGNVLRFKRTGNVFHPTEKPVDLFVVLIGNTNADTILDPFMGSGTTGVACARLGRKFIGIEIEERYFDIAVKRIDKELAQTKFDFAEAV